jgi:hypothetical protein
MSASLRIVSVAAFLIADVILLTGITKAADVVGEPSFNANVLRHATSALYLRERNCRWTSGRHHRWAAPSALVAGMRDTTPLTVPFFGFNWYPGPVHYYGPPAGSYICGREDTVISVRY